uniref:Thioredoxin n=1 Tax=Gopherus evgoodei TaxID=1825980 RepID=A0A8C4WA69_9SAUR
HLLGGGGQCAQPPRPLAGGGRSCGDASRGFPGPRRPVREGVLTRATQRAPSRGGGGGGDSNPRARAPLRHPLARSLLVREKGGEGRGANRACARRPGGIGHYISRRAAPPCHRPSSPTVSHVVSATRAATMVKTVGNLSLCEKFPDVVFLEVDVDDAQDVASECAVQCMPTFHFYKESKKVHEFSGANREKLEETIVKLR